MAHHGAVDSRYLRASGSDVVHQSEDEAEWRAILAHERLTWRADLTDDDPTTGTEHQR